MDNFLIDKQDLDLAQQVCNTILSDEIRNRAVANTFASNISLKYFADIDADIDTYSGLHNIPQILEELDISDVYIDGIYFDIRLYFNDNEIFVPKAHFDTGLVPYAYMFIKISADLSDGEVKGFIKSENIDTTKTSDDKIIISETSLESFEEITSNMPHAEGLEISNDIIFAYVENRVQNTLDLYRALTRSYDSRIKLIKAIKAQSIFNFIAIPHQEGSKTNNDTNYEINYNNSVDNDKELEEMLGDENIQRSNSEPDISNKQINSLFNKHASDKEESGYTVQNSKPSRSVLTIILPILLLLLICAGGYYGYNFYKQSQAQNVNTEMMADESLLTKDTKPENLEDAMPIETVENTNDTNADNKETANANVSIPAIEQNLDASILVQNLKISWEVPYGFAPNTASQQYFVKLGKIIQLNLKTELLLLNKPPISSKIMVEIPYDYKNKRFDNANITASSGEKTIDDLIVKTVNRAVKIKSINSNFGNVEGNPILIIRF